MGALALNLWHPLAGATPRTCVQEKRCEATAATFRPVFTLQDNFSNQSEFEFRQVGSKAGCERVLAQSLSQLPNCDATWKQAAEKENAFRTDFGREILKRVRVITVTPDSLDAAGAKYDGRRVYGFRKYWTRFFKKLQKARPLAVFLDYQFVRRSEERDSEEQRLLQALSELRKKNPFPLFSCSPYGVPADPAMAKHFQWGSCAHDLVTLEGGGESRAARYCAHGPPVQFARTTPLLLSGKEYLEIEKDCPQHHRPVVVNLLEAIGLPIPPEQFNRTEIQQGDLVYRALGVPREVTRPNWNLATVVQPGFPASHLDGKILLIGDEIPGNDVHQLGGRQVFGIYNHVNTIRALLRPRSYASAPETAEPVRPSSALASKASQSSLGP